LHKTLLERNLSNLLETVNNGTVVNQIKIILFTSKICKISYICKESKQFENLTKIWKSLEITLEKHRIKSKKIEDRNWEDSKKIKRSSICKILENLDNGFKDFYRQGKILEMISEIQSALKIIYEKSDNFSFSKNCENIFHTYKKILIHVGTKGFRN
ncbi:hypothetical protein QML37_31575, partial [Klebsiella pneumoniae]|uniref:hypothetical protein n=1 Tax=Klebsiella pneumoniae TaxID=573 RepID=UPI003A801AE8